MIGTTLSHFQITAKLGEGGMGEVYRATDTKLGREVAIKVLPEAVATDPERLARFEREAKVLASLNHPHIAAIYSIEAADHQDRPSARLASQEDGYAALGERPAAQAPPPSERGEHAASEEEAPRTVHFLVMELAEGEDLADRMRRGPVPSEEALPIALQIAQALEAAHERGIIHRDLKPANVKVDPKGNVKVLDFGLAKALETGAEADGTPRAASLSMSPTLTAQMTQAGVLLGTAAYMSPEQAAGEPADRRADIWAFGVVLAEMLSGRRQFEGKTTSHVLAAVLKEEPDWDRLAAVTPPAIVDLLRHCLRKEPSQRLQAIGDARILIEDYLENPAAFVAASRIASANRLPAWREILPWALFALLGVAFAVWKIGGPEPAPSNQVFRASILPPADTNFYLASWNPGPVAVSPDGKKLTFAVQDRDGTVRLYVQTLDSGVAQVLPATESAAYPFWSSDSRWVGFFTDVDQTLKKIDTTGGPPVTICDAVNGKGGSWNRDGVILFAPSSETGIHQVPASGGEPKPVTEIASGRYNSHRHPRFLPDGRHFLYLARAAIDQDSTLMLGSLDGSVDREIVRTSTQGELAADHLLFTRGTTLMAQPFDSDRFELTGDATALAEKVVTVKGAALGVFSASDSGLLAFSSGEIDPETSLEWRDRTGELLDTVGEPAIFGTIALAPDGEKVVSVNYDSGGVGSLWLTEIDTGRRSHFTFEAMSNFGLAWSPTSDSVFFSAQRDSAYEIDRKAVSGVGETELLYGQKEDLILCGISPDERTLLFYQSDPVTNRDLWTVTLPQGGDPKVFLQSSADERCGPFSPDGRWVAYPSNESGRYEIYLAPFPGPGRRWQVSQDGGLFPQWRADGREIVYSQPDGQLMAAQIETGPDTLEVRSIEPLFRIHPPRPDGASFALAPDGQRILVWTSRQSDSDIVIHLVVNWPAELLRR